MAADRWPLHVSRPGDVAAPLVVIVAQAFKESLGAAEVGARMAAGVRAAGANPEIVLGSDGGDGLLEALRDLTVRRDVISVTGPLGRATPLEMGWLDRETAVVESRLACGLSLVGPTERDPRVTTSRGVGEAIDTAVRHGARRVVLGLGGSATMDGGVGMARAWDWVPLDGNGEEMPEGGGSLGGLVRLKPGRRPGLEVDGLCDVRNPLTGPRGARVYAAQKGATPEQEEALAIGLGRLADVVDPGGRRGWARAVGAGAAGGLGFGVLAFAGGRLVGGASWVLERVGFDDLLGRAQLVVTGEGAFDATSLEGKLTGEVLSRSRAAGVPCLLIAPSARAVPPGVHVESAAGHWSADELERRARRATERVLRLLVS